MKSMIGSLWHIDNFRGRILVKYILNIISHNSPSTPQSRSWGACVPRRSQRLWQLEFWLLVGTTMLDRLWARGQTKCNTLLMLTTSVFGRILLTTLLCDVVVKVQAGHLMAQWRGMHGSYLVPYVLYLRCPLPGKESEQAWDSQD